MDLNNANRQAQLVTLLREGSLAAFNKIYGLYAHRLLEYVSVATRCREDAEEIVHDIFMNLWNNRSKLDPAQPLSTLLFALAYRRRVDYFRQWMRLPVYEDYRHLANELTASSHDELEYRDYMACFERALDSLSDRARQVVTLSRLQGLSNQQIADKLGINEKTVRNVSSAALKELYATLKSLLNNH